MYSGDVCGGQWANPPLPFETKYGWGVLIIRETVLMLAQLDLTKEAKRA